MDYIVVLITAPTAADARRIARTLVEERLAACVNVLTGCESVYRWEEKVVEEAEAMMVAKTSRDLFPALAKRVGEIHPYAVPEVIGLPLTEVAERYRLFLDDGVRRARSPL
ncbi:MAG TPA: divalent cation tolerance protein CutA [Candidatus Krumholzibacteria bacterium]|nr:divalent cation tolerance protein CutA [Candidatus Krumholzibacteria bacterium]